MNPLDQIAAGPNNCWAWTRARNDMNYGQVSSDGRVQYAHRIVYELLIGPIPEGLVLDHLCRNPPCVNPAHLEPVTFQENLNRGFGRNKTHCPHGHTLTEDNLDKYKLRMYGQRMCRTCKNIGMRKGIRKHV